MVTPAPKPPVAILMNARPLTRPISVGFASASAAIFRQAARSRGFIPMPAAKSFAVPSGRTARENGGFSSFGSSAWSVATSAFTVPSPPPATRQSIPSSAARASASRVRRSVSPSSQVTRTDTSWPASRTLPTAARTSSRCAALPLRIRRKWLWLISVSFTSYPGSISSRSALAARASSISQLRKARTTGRRVRFSG